MIIERISIVKVVLFFVAYLLIHILIGITTKNIKKKLDEKPGNLELENTYKWMNRLFNWFPVIYVIFLLFVL